MKSSSVLVGYSSAPIYDVISPLSVLAVWLSGNGVAQSNISVEKKRRVLRKVGHVIRITGILA